MKSKRLFLMLGLGSSLLAALLFFRVDEARDSFPARRQFEVTYQAKMDGPPPGSQSVRLWIPLASSREGQTILKREISAPAAYQITRDPVYGNEMAYFDLRPPIPEPFHFEARYRVEMSSEDFERKNQEKDGLEKYLSSTHLMAVDEEVRKRAVSATGGRKTWLDKARGIYEDVIHRMSYDKTAPGWGRGDTVRACLLGKGNCTDFHSLFISMAHAAEIPARFKIGLTLPNGAGGEIPGYHCWAEFYEEGKGWRPVDASEAWKHPEKKETYFGNFDTNKFLISVGRDIDLVPRQSGPPVNIFFYPTIEADGKEWQGAKTSFRFKDLKLEEGKNER